MKADIKLPDKITGIIAELNDAGYEAYAVGGCVRDLFMGKIPNDYDVTTSALPEQIKAVFNGCKIYDVGIEHGTVLIVYKETPVEITTYRRESGYSDKRRPDKVEFVGKLSEDLKRRDFTVNAIAFDGESTVDIFGGINDIRNKIIRCVGNPDDRFNEDALRIIRALRFSSRLGFEIEAKTKEALQKNAKNLSFVAAERIQKEFIRLVEGEHFYKTAAEFKDVIKLAAQSKALLNISALQSAEPDFAVRFALMFGSDGERVLDNLKFSGAHRKKVRSVLRCKDIKTDRRSAAELVNEIGREDFKLVRGYLNAVSQNGDEFYEKMRGLAIKSVKELDINGADLINAFDIEGKRVGELLHKLYLSAACGECQNKKVELLKFAKENIGF